jgi:enamine deaminase RidA (YjgF/YER057c/UK114 family)
MSDESKDNLTDQTILILKKCEEILKLLNNSETTVFKDEIVAKIIEAKDELDYMLENLSQ